MDWRKLVNQEQMVQWRRYLHQHAEASFEEVETTQYICDVLSQMPGIEIHRPAKTGVLAVLKGKKPGKTVALRADIDALRMKEDSGESFCSLNPETMHACGHDVHTSMLLGAAAVLSSMQDELCGTVKFIFQHAEEAFPGGAKDFVASGLLDDVDCVFGEHVVANTPIDRICCWPGPTTASPDQFTIVVKGKGSHGASPEESIDPITIGAQLVMALNTIVSRNISPLDNAVVTVAKFHAGSSFNIIAPTAELSGTVRTNQPAIREFIKKRMNEIAEYTCKAHGADYELTYIDGYDAILNDPDHVEIVHRVARNLYGEGHVVRIRSLMAGDDFAAYQKVAPVAFMTIGCGENSHQAHHPKFHVDENMMTVGCEMYVGCTLEALGCQ